MINAIAQNLKITRERIVAAEKRAARMPGSVELLAVSKKWSAEVIAEAAAAGQLAFGENRVQELVAKVPVLAPDLRWHLIGHLQKNKVKKVLPLVGDIHSIDSLSVLRAVDREAGKIGVRRRIFLQVNIGEDPAKHGFQAEELAENGVLEACDGLENLDLAGLMTIPPFSETAEGARRYFAALRELRDKVTARTGTALPGLSMGMSGDYEVAIEEGATVVRVGSSIFGQRPR